MRKLSDSRWRKLIPETAGRPWVVWLWVPLLCAPFLWFYSR